jgi:hypothetical protein
MTFEEVMDLLVAIKCTPEQIATAAKLISMRVPAVRKGDGGDAFARFWGAWPNKVGKPAAERAFRKVAGEVEDILAGVERYVRTKSADRPWLNPATFINQRRWEDQPAPVSLPVYDARKDGIALLLDEVRNHEQRQTEIAGPDVRRLSVLPSLGGDAVGDVEDIFGSSGNLHR